MSDAAVASFDRGLDRRLVHRTSNASVFLTDVWRKGPASWTLGVQVPRPPFVGQTAVSDVPLPFGVEVLRQCGLAVAHRGYDVPLGHAFTIQDISFAWTRGAAAAYPEYGPFEVLAHLDVIEHLQRREETSGLRVRCRLESDRGVVADGGGLLRCMSPAHFQALRRRTRPAGVVARRYDTEPLRRVERHRDELTGLLAWNQSDPFVFDHPTDHVPGMAMLVGLEHAARLLRPGRCVATIAMTYERFVEFVPAPDVRAVAVGDEITAEVFQGGTRAARGVCVVGA